MTRWLRVCRFSALFIGGCSQQGGVTAPSPGLQPGILELYGESPEIAIPDTVSRGQTLIVTVLTYGGGCVRRGPTDAHVEGLLAVVEPYDTVLNGGRGGVCTTELRQFSHQVTLRFEASGTARVRGVGRRVAGGGRERVASPLTIEHKVIVR